MVLCANREQFQWHLEMWKDNVPREQWCRMGMTKGYELSSFCIEIVQWNPFENGKKSNFGSQTIGNAIKWDFQLSLLNDVPFQNLKMENDSLQDAS